MPTPSFRSATFAQETGDAFLILIEIGHPQIIDGPLRFSSDAVDTVSNGHTYTALPFTIELPADTDDSLPEVKLSIDNVGREMAETIRALTTAPTVRVSVVLASAPDVLEAGPLEFRLASADVDAVQVSGTLAWESLLAEPFPADSFLPSTHPAVF